MPRKSIGQRASPPGRHHSVTVGGIIQESRAALSRYTRAASSESAGKEVLREARSYYSAPILVLSARDGEAEKIEALDLGADDYVEKPFAIGELLARLRTALRHRNGGAVEHKLVEAGRKAQVPPLPLAGEGRGEGRRPYQHRRRPLSSRRMRSIRPRALRATPRRTARSTESRKRQKGFAFTRCSPSRISHLLLLIDPSCRAIHASSLSESNA